MLINIDPILSPEILHTLRAIGHGDKLVLCDSNFPAYSMNSRVHRIDGVDTARATGYFIYFPLDSFIEHPLIRMQIDDKPEELNDVHKELNDVMLNEAGPNWTMGSIERFKFYEEAKKAYAIITTNETRPFGCFILTKGVVKPDGSVWVLDK